MSEPSNHQAETDQAEDQAFVVFTAAIERYLATQDAAAATAFETWLEAHVDDEELLAHLVQTYPKFGEIFTDEIEKAAVARPAA